MPDYIPIAKYLADPIPLLDLMVIVVLMCIRCSGKSTLLYQMIDHILKTSDFLFYSGQLKNMIQSCKPRYDWIGEINVDLWLNVLFATD